MQRFFLSISNAWSFKIYAFQILTHFCKENFYKFQLMKRKILWFSSLCINIFYKFQGSILSNWSQEYWISWCYDFTCLCKLPGPVNDLSQECWIFCFWLYMPTLISKWFVTFITRVMNFLMFWLHMPLQAYLISK